MHPRIETLIERFPWALRLARAARGSWLQLRGSRSIFERHYSRNYWGSPESRSGQGSDLEQTRVLRRELPEMLKRLGVSSFLDVPCGDLFWIKQTPLQLHRYVGGDIVPPLVERNRRESPELFGARTEFQVLDVMASPLPKCDAIMCRDCLVHLSHDGVMAALANIKKSGATYLLTTTFPRVEHNRDILTGEWRPLNLCLPPFSLPPPLELLLEECTEAGGMYADKSLGVWRVEDIGVRA